VSTGPTPEGVFASSKDGAVWRDATPAVVRHPAVYGRNSIYYGSSPLAATAYGQGWLVAGFRRDNGRVSAAVWRSTDGASWLPASGVKPTDLLAASDTTERTVNDVTAVGTAGYAVGGAEKNGAAQPVAYTSTDGLHWTSRVLPMPAGYVGGELDTVSALPNGTVVGLGAISTGGTDPRQVAIAYASTDHGRTWTSTVLPGATGAAQQSRRAAVNDSTQVGSRIVAVGALGDRSNPDAAIWSTADGKQWRYDTIRDSRLTGAGYQQLSTVAGLGGDLVGVGEAYTQSGQSLVVLRQPQQYGGAAGGGRNPRACPGGRPRAVLLERHPGHRRGPGGRRGQDRADHPLPTLRLQGRPGRGVRRPGVRALSGVVHGRDQRTGSPGADSGPLRRP
jgi:hypothetical protein